MSSWLTIKDNNIVEEDNDDNNNSNITDEGFIYSLRQLYSNAINDIYIYEKNNANDHDKTIWNKSIDILLHIIQLCKEKLFIISSKKESFNQRRSLVEEECNQIYYLAAKNISKLYEREGKNNKIMKEKSLNKAIEATEVMLKINFTIIDFSIILRVGRMALDLGDIWTCKHLLSLLQDKDRIKNKNGNIETSIKSINISYDRLEGLYLLDGDHTCLSKPYIDINNSMYECWKCLREELYKKLEDDTINDVNDKILGNCNQNTNLININLDENDGNENKNVVLFNNVIRLFKKEKEIIIDDVINEECYNNDKIVIEIDKTKEIEVIDKDVKPGTNENNQIFNSTESVTIEESSIIIIEIVNEIVKKTINSLDIDLTPAVVSDEIKQLEEVENDENTRKSSRINRAPPKPLPLYSTVPTSNGFEEATSETDLIQIKELFATVFEKEIKNKIIANDEINDEINRFNIDNTISNDLNDNDDNSDLKINLENNKINIKLFVQSFMKLSTPLSCLEALKSWDFNSSLLNSDVIDKFSLSGNDINDEEFNLSILSLSLDTSRIHLLSTAMIEDDLLEIFHNKLIKNQSSNQNKIEINTDVCLLFISTSSQLLNQLLISKIIQDISNNSKNYNNSYISKKIKLNNEIYKTIEFENISIAILQTWSHLIDMYNYSVIMLVGLLSFGEKILIAECCLDVIRLITSRKENNNNNISSRSSSSSSSSSSSNSTINNHLQLESIAYTTFYNILSIFSNEIDDLIQYNLSPPMEDDENFKIMSVINDLNLLRLIRILLISSLIDDLGQGNLSLRRRVSSNAIDITQPLWRSILRATSRYQSGINLPHVHSYWSHINMNSMYQLKKIYDEKDLNISTMELSFKQIIDSNNEGDKKEDIIWLEMVLKILNHIKSLNSIIISSSQRTDVTFQETLPILFIIGLNRSSNNSLMIKVISNIVLIVNDILFSKIDKNSKQDEIDDNIKKWFVDAAKYINKLLEKSNFDLSSSDDIKIFTNFDVNISIFMINSFVKRDCQLCEVVSKLGITVNNRITCTSSDMFDHIENIASEMCDSSSSDENHMDISIERDENVNMDDNYNSIFIRILIICYLHMSDSLTSSFHLSSPTSNSYLHKFNSKVTSINGCDTLSASEYSFEFIMSYCFIIQSIIVKKIIWNNVSRNDIYSLCTASINNLQYSIKPLQTTVSSSSSSFPITLSSGRIASKSTPVILLMVSIAILHQSIFQINELSASLMSKIIIICNDIVVREDYFLADDGELSKVLVQTLLYTLRSIRHDYGDKYINKSIKSNFISTNLTQYELFDVVDVGSQIYYYLYNFPLSETVTKTTLNKKIESKEEIINLYHFTRLLDQFASAGKADIRTAYTILHQLLFVDNKNANGRINNNNNNKNNNATYNNVLNAHVKGYIVKYFTGGDDNNNNLNMFVNNITEYTHNQDDYDHDDHDIINSKVWKEFLIAFYYDLSITGLDESKLDSNANINNSSIINKQNNSLHSVDYDKEKKKILNSFNINLIYLSFTPLKLESWFPLLGLMNRYLQLTIDLVGELCISESLPISIINGLVYPNLMHAILPLSIEETKETRQALVTKILEINKNITNQNTNGSMLSINESISPLSSRPYNNNNKSKLQLAGEFSEIIAIKNSLVVLIDKVVKFIFILSDINNINTNKMEILESQGYTYYNLSHEYSKDSKYHKEYLHKSYINFNRALDMHCKNGIDNSNNKKDGKMVSVFLFYICGKLNWNLTKNPSTSLPLLVKSLFMHDNESSVNSSRNGTSNKDKLSTRLTILNQISSIRIKTAINYLKNITLSSTKEFNKNQLEELNTNINILEKYSYNFSSNSIQDINLIESEDMNKDDISNNNNEFNIFDTVDKHSIALVIDRLWGVVINSFCIMKLCRKLDTFDCKSIYRISKSICCLLDIDDQVKANDKPSFIPIWVHDRLNDVVNHDAVTIDVGVSTIDLIKNVLNGIIEQVIVKTELKEDESFVIVKDTISEIIINIEEIEATMEVDDAKDEDNNDIDVNFKVIKNSINDLTISSNSINNSNKLIHMPIFFSRLNSLQVLRPLFDKKRSQIVAIWCVEISNSGFDQIIQRTLKFDHLRKKYLKFYLELCILNNQLSYITDIISYILGSRNKTSYLDWGIEVSINSYIQLMYDQMLKYIETIIASGDKLVINNTKLLVDTLLLECYVIYNNSKKYISIQSKEEFDSLMVNMYLYSKMYSIQPANPLSVELTSSSCPRVEFVEDININTVLSNCARKNDTVKSKRVNFINNSYTNKKRKSVNINDIVNKFSSNNSNNNNNLDVNLHDDDDDDNDDSTNRYDEGNLNKGNRKWSEEETRAMFNGVLKFGKGQWVKIKQDNKCLSQRSTLQIGDKYRFEIGKRVKIVSIPSPLPSGSPSPMIISPTPMLLSTSSSLLINQDNINENEIINQTLNSSTELSLNVNLEGQRVNKNKRIRINWSDEEERCFLEGIEHFGVGSWTKIIQTYPNILSKRNSQNLKDKYKSIQNKREKKIKLENNNNTNLTAAFNFLNQ